MMIIEKLYWISKGKAVVRFDGVESPASDATYFLFNAPDFIDIDKRKRIELFEYITRKNDDKTFFKRHGLIYNRASKSFELIGIRDDLNAKGYMCIDYNKSLTSVDLIASEALVMMDKMMEEKQTI